LQLFSSCEQAIGSLESGEDEYKDDDSVETSNDDDDDEYKEDDESVEALNEGEDDAVGTSGSKPNDLDALRASFASNRKPTRTEYTGLERATGWCV